MITIIYNVIIIIANINKKVAGVLVTGIISLIIKCTYTQAINVEVPII